MMINWKLFCIKWLISVLSNSGALSPSPSMLSWRQPGPGDGTEGQKCIDTLWWLQLWVLIQKHNTTHPFHDHTFGTAQYFQSTLPSCTVGIQQVWVQCFKRPGHQDVCGRMEEIFITGDTVCQARPMDNWHSHNLGAIFLSRWWRRQDI